MTALPVVANGDCWNRIGVHGDRSCPELAGVVHCQNCPVFAAAGRRFLDAPSPADYVAEWTQRLAAPMEESATDLQSVLIFRLGDEWLALPVQILVEVTPVRVVHRVPYHGGLLAGLVNIRGELQLCVHLAGLLGIQETGARSEGVRSESLSPLYSGERGWGEGAGAPVPSPPTPLPRVQGRGEQRNQTLEQKSQPRFLVVEREAARWVFPVDAVDQVQRFPAQELTKVPPTVGRAAAHLTRGVFHWDGRYIGYLDEARLFEALRAKVR